MWSLLLKHDELERMKASRFRRSWHLDELDKKRISSLGLLEIEKHARAIIEDRLKVKPANDGKQTPYKGHPIFKAMHATATCCRGCIFSWHRIPPYKTLDEKDMNFLIHLMMRWLNKELNINDGTLMPYVR